MVDHLEIKSKLDPVINMPPHPEMVRRAFHSDAYHSDEYALCHE